MYALPKIAVVAILILAGLWPATAWCWPMDLEGPLLPQDELGEREEQAVGSVEKKVKDYRKKITVEEMGPKLTDEELARGWVSMWREGRGPNPGVLALSQRGLLIKSHSPEQDQADLQVAMSAAPRISGSHGTPPGHGGTPPGHGGTPPGHGGTPPGQGGKPPGGGKPPDPGKVPEPGTMLLLTGGIGGVWALRRRMHKL